MKKLLKIILWTIGITVAFVTVTIVLLQFVLSNDFINDKLKKGLSEIYDGTVSCSNVSASFLERFPKLIVNVENLSLTYPHDRFPEIDSTSTVVDTLASLGKLDAEVNLLDFLSGKIRVYKADIVDPVFYAKTYKDGQANWDLFKIQTSKKEKDTTSFCINFSVDRLSISGRPRVFYSSPRDTVFLALLFRNFTGAADFKITESEMKIDKVDIDLDSLAVFGRFPADTMAFGLDYLRIDKTSRHTIDLSVSAKAGLFSKMLGRITLPLVLETSMRYDNALKYSKITIPSFTANVAYIPLKLHGELKVSKEGAYVDAGVSVENCDIQKLISEYGKKSPELSLLRTDALLSLTANAKGFVSNGKKPEVDAKVHLSPCSLEYKPDSSKLNLSLDVAARMNEKGKLNIVADHVSVSSVGLSVSAKGNILDCLSSDPRFVINGSIDADADELSPFLTEYCGIRTSGELDAEVSIDAKLSEFDRYAFEKASVSGRARGHKLEVVLPADSLTARLDGTAIKLSSGEGGIFLDLDIDSLRLAQDKLVVRARNMHNKLTISKMEIRDRLTPYVSVESVDSALFLKTGNDMIGIQNISASAKMIKMIHSRNREFVPPKDTSFHLPDFLTEKDFEKSDISFNLDSSMDSLVREWRPMASLSSDRAFIVSPSLPLKTGIRDLKVDFNGNVLSLESMNMKLGTSDFSARGKLSGLFRMMRGKGVLDLDLDVKSKRLNLNELINSLKTKESQTLTQTQTRKTPLIVIPANLVADLRLDADRVDYSSLNIGPLTAGLKTYGRCLQLKDVFIDSDYAVMALDAYYSTKTKKDISAGVDIRMVDVDAEKIIRLIPAIDSIFPLLQSFKGNLGCEISATAALDTNMNVIFPSMDGIVRISGEDLMIDDAGDLRKVTRLLMFKNKNIGKIKNMYVDAIIHNNSLEVYPFVVEVDRYKLALGGVQGFDNQFNYHISVLHSPFIIRLGLNITGNTDKWRFSLCSPKYKRGIPSYTKQLDSMQLNIADGIQNIYKKGVDYARKQGKEGVYKLNRKKIDEDEETSLKDFMQMDSLNLSYEMEQESESVQAEIDECISSTSKNIEKLTREYEETIYDERLSDRLKRMREAYKDKSRIKKQM